MAASVDVSFPAVWLAHRVSYGETDTMGVLYYAEYLHIFERGRSELIRAYGFSYAEVEKRGLFLPVRDAACRYRSPARYDDLLQLETRVTEWKRASLVFGYRLYDERKQHILAEGSTQHACVDNAGKPMAVPGWFKEMFTARPDAG